SFLYSSGDYSSLPSFPTRRSSDLAHEIGFIFQAFHLLPTFTAIENVQIPMFENHQSRVARKTRALELLKSVGLEPRVNHFPAKLDRKSTRLNSSHLGISYAVFCLK